MSLRILTNLMGDIEDVLSSATEINTTEKSYL